MGRPLPSVKAIFAESKINAAPSQLSESDIQKTSESDEREKLMRDLDMINLLNTLLPLKPVVKKIKNNKKPSHVTVQDSESEKSETPDNCQMTQ